MKIRNELHGEHLTLHLAGHWDAGVHTLFRRAVRQALETEPLRMLTLEISDIEYIDSSALGMLLLLHGDTEKRGIPVTLVGARPFVLKVLKMANFHKLFKID
jgi:anti-anti-sigma factor